MKIRTRIYLGLLISGLIVTLSCFLVFSSIKYVLSEIGTSHLSSLNSIQKIKSDLAEAVEESFAYLVSGEIQEKNEFLQWVDRFDLDSKQFANLEKLTQPGKGTERATFKKIVSEQRKLVQFAQLAFKEYEEKGLILTQTFKQYEDSIDTITADLDKLLIIERREAKDSQLLAFQTLQNLESFCYQMGFLAILLALGLGSWVNRIVINPLEKLEEGALKIGDRQFDIRVESNNRDEIGIVRRRP